MNRKLVLDLAGLLPPLFSARLAAESVGGTLWGVSLGAAAQGVQRMRRLGPWAAKV